MVNPQGDMSEKEAQEILRDFSASKSNVHSFLTKIIQSPDTLKTGNLTEDELGMPHLPVRTYKELQLFSEDIANQKEWGEYFGKMSEIQTASSLSKEALLVKLAVTQTKQLADISKGPRKVNTGWFKSKKDPGAGMSEQGIQ